MARDDLGNGPPSNPGSSRAASAASSTAHRCATCPRPSGRPLCCTGSTWTSTPERSRGLVGENGSGKSTLIKILAGFHEPDPGAEVLIRGQAVELPMDPVVSRELGLSFVHQDLALVPSLSVTENMTVGSLTDGRLDRFGHGVSSPPPEPRSSRYGLDIDPRRAISSLTPLQRAMIAIVRAIEGMRATQERGEASLLVLDEPTVFLPKSDRATLFDLARQHTAVGGSVLFVSHDLEECLEVTDRITVLRDGFLQGTVTTGEVDRSEIIRMMVGKHLDFQSHREDAPAAEPAPRARGEGDQRRQRRRHRSEPCARRGRRHHRSARFRLRGCAVPHHGGDPRRGRHHRARRRDASPVPLPAGGCRARRTSRWCRATAPRDGSVVSLSVLDNISVQSLRRYRRPLGIDWKALGKMARDLVVQYDVRPPKVDARYGTLSGGNQQKVMLAKWLHTNPKVLVLHEPTQGVDVGAREQIFTIIRQGARNGAAVLCASADQEQLALVCDRVLIMRDGRIAAELVGAQVTKANIANETLQAKSITKDAR